MPKQPRRTNVIVDFLNLDFELDDFGEFKEKHGHRFSHGMNEGRAKKEGKRVQAEVLSDLTPIVCPAKALNIIDAEMLLRKLIMKINAMRFKPFWSIDPADYGTEISDDGQEIVWKEVKKESIYLGRGQRTFSVLNYRWFFGIEDTLLRRGLSWRAAIYAAILEALESGEFPRLKKCPECDRFFVAEPQNRRYCTDECTTEADKKEAAKRVKDGRKKKREARQRTSWSATDQKAFDLFYWLLDAARVERMNQETYANRASMGRRLATLREKWEQGDSANELWLGLNEAIKNDLRDRARKGVKFVRRPRKARGGLGEGRRTPAFR